MPEASRVIKLRKRIAHVEFRASLGDGEVNASVILELFEVLSSPDESFGMSFLARRDSEATFMIIPAKAN
jgi:hypothetical protein